MSRKNICIKRILTDIKELSEEYNEYIHIYYNENNLKNIKALIIGPKDTPYEDGFYFFDINIPDTYPFNHPSVDFKTINGDIRFNPNLYETGKVCLSIIGTWSGPKWSAIQSLKSLLLSIQSLLNENPINNEPSFELINPIDSKAVDYNDYIKYNNYNFAMYEMLNNKNYYGKLYFNSIIENYFIKNYNKIKSKFNDLKKHDNKIVNTFIWNHSVKLDYNSLINKFDILYDKLKDKDFSNIELTSVHTN